MVDGDPPQFNEADELRRGAEERLDKLAAAEAASPVPEDVAAVLHELRVHQIELEMQNEELRRAQLELQASREKYFELFDLAPVGYLTLSDQSIVRDANLTAALLLGVERPLFVGKPFTAFICASDQDVYYQHQRMLVQTGEPQACELRLKRAGDEADAEAAPGYFWAHLEGRPQRDGDGATRLLSVILADITERKHAEEALHESEEQFRRFAEYLPGRLTIKDAELRYVYGNDERAAESSLPSTRWIGKAPEELWTPEEALAIREIGERVLAGEVVEEVRESAAERGMEYSRSVHFPIAGGAGTVMVGGISLDITELVEAQEKLQLQEMQLRTILESTGDGILAIDDAGRVIKTNQRFADLWRISSDLLEKGNDEALLTYVLDQLVDPDAFLEKVHALYASTTVDLDTILFKDGRIVERYSCPLLSEGVINGRVWSFRDSTERKQAEEEIRRQAQQLRRTVEGTVLAMSLMVETRDPYTAGHERRVSELAAAIAEEMGMAGEQLESLRLAGLIHDIGKIAVPAEILAKPGRLSTVEFNLIKQHPESSFDILGTIDFGRPVAEMVLQHHERLDGSGYPRGLSGEQVMAEARILAVADVVEAMSSHRPYRAALGMEAALAEIREHAGVKYDAAVVASCVGLVKRGFVFSEP